jgi:pimeloyl-ACP methyl ester carboxylesterase
MNASGGMLRVPGASLYYTVHGSGPILLMLQGGAGDADGSDSLVAHLVSHYTVVTYDRRGLSRSTLDEGAEALMRLETHSDDVHHLLAALTTAPAYVFGSSIGALIGLDLVARHPDQVRTLVAHEPATPALLPDGERAQVTQTQADVEQTHRSEGVAAAMRKMVTLSGVNLDDREQDVELPAPTSHGVTRLAPNLDFFLTYDAPAVRRYRPNLDALQAASPRVVVAAGHSSQGLWLYRASRALADQIGSHFVEFPGGHNGYVLHPRGFAGRLREVLDDLPAGTRVTRGS